MLHQWRWITVGFIFCAVTLSVVTAFAQGKPSTSAVPVRAKPDAKAEVNLQPEVPAIVEVFEVRDAWTLIGRSGTPLGYVPSNAVQRIKE